MRRTPTLFLFATFFLAPVSLVFAQAAPPANPGVPQDGYPTQVYVTCYAPGAGGNIEGPFATSKPNLNGQSIPCTLDDFRLKRNGCWYVSLAGNPANYGKYYNMGSVTYVSIIDNRTYTMTNVVGYVHDTGSAFQGGTCGNYNGMCSVMMRHFDIAYGDFRGGGNVSYVNTNKLCTGSTPTWKQIGGRVDLPSSVTPGEYVSGAGPGAVPYTGSTPYTAARPTGSPFGAAAPYPVSSSGTVAQGASPSSYGSSAVAAPTPVSQQLSPFSGITAPQQPLAQSQSVPNGPTVASLYLQPRTVARGGNVVISWTSLNMDPAHPCVVSISGIQLAQAAEGTKILPAASLASGTFSATLACRSQKGESIQKTDSVTIQS